MEITPLVERGRQMIQSYGGGGFVIAGERRTGSVLVFPDRTMPWAVREFAELAAPELVEATAAAAIELLIIGSGGSAEPASPALRAALREAGIAVDVMATGAACRTFNVLLAEDRRLAAALIAVD